MITLTFVALSTIFFLRKKLSKRSILYLSIIPLLIIVWTRFGLGADYFSYANMYNILNVDGISSIYSNFAHIEVGFKLLMYPFRLFNIPYYIFLGTINSIVTIIIIKWIDDNSNCFPLSVLLFFSMFFFVWVLSAVRQSIVLAVALYYLFNKEKNLGLKYEVVIILLLSFVHKSSIILLLIVLLKRIKWTRGMHIFLMLLSISITTFPIKLFLESFNFIPFANKLLSYTSDNKVIFYDFPGLVRLIMFMFIILFYKYLKDDNNNVDQFLYGTSIYFMLKFSETTASRSTIFTFILLVVILPDLVLLLSDKIDGKFKIIIPILSLSFCFVYFSKEYNTMFNQSKYNGDFTYFTYPNIFTPNINDFNSKESFDYKLRSLTSSLSEKLGNNNYGKVEYNDGQRFLNINIDGKNFLIDQNGEILDVDNVRNDDYILDGIYVGSGYKEKYFFSYTVLTDLSNKNRSIESMEKSILSYTQKNFNGEYEERVTANINDLPEEIVSMFPNLDSVEKVVVNRVYNEYINYFIVRLDYLGIKNYFYLNDAWEAIIPLPSSRPFKFDREGFLSLKIYDNKIIVNSEGEIISWEN